MKRNKKTTPHLMWRGRRERPPQIRRRKRLRGLEAPSRITLCGMLIAVRSDLAGPSLGPPRNYQNPKMSGFPGFVILICLKPCDCSPARDGSPRSSIERSLDSKEMASMSPPPAHFVSPRGDDEVVSQKTFLDRGSLRRSSGWRPRMIPQSPDTWGESPYGDW